MKKPLLKFLKNTFKFLKIPLGKKTISYIFTKYLQGKKPIVMKSPVPSMSIREVPRYRGLPGPGHEGRCGDHSHNVTNCSIVDTKER